MSGDTSPNTEELKTYLKDAGMFEENMSYNDMYSYYKVLKCSENTAQQEQEQRSITEDFNVELKSNLSTNSIVDEDEDKDKELTPTPPSPKLNRKTNTKASKSKFSLIKSDESSTCKLLKNNSNQTEEKEVEYNVLDSPTSKHRPLDIILYERKYELPPHCNPKFNNLSITQKAKMICNFHRAILNRFYKLHCESLNPAPWGKSIPANDKIYSASDRKSGALSDELDFLNTEEENTDTLEIYTSRSGRQTKRRMYIDPFEEEDDNESKKSKKNADKPFEVEKKAVAKRQTYSKLTNQDIMKKSKLFSEPTKSTRTEKLFDLIKGEDTKEKEKKENKNKKEDENKLKPDEKLEDIESMKVDIEEPDESTPNLQESQSSGDEVQFVSKSPPFIPRRVPPPLRGRRGIGSRRQPANTDAGKSNGSTPTTTSTIKSTPSSPVVTTSQPKSKSLLGKAKCPICSQVFFQEEIETHASSCGLGMETESNFSTASPSGIKKIKCEICDKEFILNKDFEVHVSECIAVHSRSEN